MSNNSGNNTGAASSEVPALHSFEFDKTAIGNIKSSVNKFRGCVSLPLDFMTLPGLEGLDVKLSVLYSSNIKKSLNTWNLEAATGILGLGWQMPIEMIIADKGGSASATSDSYYMVTGGSANPMIKTGETTDGNWVYQLRNFQFWSVQYNPLNKIWIIIKENGFAYTYGAGTDIACNATQWGISCGNWIGSTNVGASQVQYPVAWNLASIVTPMGNKVQYQYLNINQQLISSAIQYTQASYLKKVIDSYGRTITFSYGNKYGLLNPGSAPDGNPIIEYQPQHTQIPPPSANAYQDRYETCFLDAVDVADADGKPLSGLKFTYGFINNASTSDSNYSLLYKRCLQSVFQYAADGETLPAMNFEYFPTTSSSTNPGALKAVTYPEGGRASFEYKPQTITSPNSSKKIQISNPVSGSTPRVWFGSDYIVFTYAGNNKIQVKIQSWNGQWVNQDIIISKTAVTGSLMVLSAENFFALSFRNSATNNDELYLFRNDGRGQALQFGKWAMYNNQPFVLTLKSGAGSSVFVAGDSFVMAYNKSYTTNSVQGFSYTWQDGLWNGSTTPPVPPSSDCQYAAITASQNFYAVSCYLQSARQIKNYIYYRAADGTWTTGSNWTLSNIDVLVDTQSATAYLTVSPMPASLVLTFATTATSSVINYSLRSFNWDERFYVLNPASPASADLSSPIVNGKLLYEIFQTLIVGATVNNNLALLRNGGGDQQYGSVWKQRAFTAPGSTIALNLAAGEDVSILSPSSGSSANQLATFNPNYGTWNTSSGQPGNNPSISGNYMTVGKTIYYRDTSGTWKSLSTQLNSFNYPQSLQNRGPRYLAYQDASDASASTYVVALKNGNAQSPQKLSGVKIYNPDNLPGTMLAAGRFLVTYPSSATSFDTAPSMDLWNIDDVNFDLSVSDTPVAYVVIEDKFDPKNNYSQSFYYYNSPESQIVFNALMGVAQYPLVIVVPGIGEKAGTPTATPEGSSQYFYSNGLAQQSTLYPLGGVQNYQNILNGIQLGQKDFDQSGKMVSSQLDYWTVYTQDQSSKNLFGGYARCEKTAITKDGILQWSRAGYDNTTGVLLWQEKSYWDAQGTPKNTRQETLYAYQVPEYAAAFTQLHIFTAVAMTTQRVSPADESSHNYISSQATTYRNWANTGAVTVDCTGTGPCRLAAYQTFDWATPGSAAPQFPSASNAQAAWQLKVGIISRTNKQYLITEQVESNGLVSSFLYDEGQQFLVAKFPNGSIAGNEVSYYGFEDYETVQGWSIGSGASIIPNQQNTIVDAHTGTKSLSIAAATAGSNGIQKSFTPVRQNQQYVFSAWVKKPSGFNNASGNAFWAISVAGGTSYTLNFPDTVGQWMYVFQLITLPSPNGAAQISIACANSNTASNVLVDNLRFTPLASIIEAYSYNRKLQPPAVILGPNGETSQNLYNNFGQQTLSTNAADRTSKIQSGYFSRNGNQDLFSISDPNHSLTITGSNGGQVTAFSRGSEWETEWQPQANTWKVEGTILTQQSGGKSGWLTSNNLLSSNYALDVEFKVLETVASPLGIQLGSDITVQWNPQLTCWQLLNSAGADLLPQVDARAFALPANPYVAQLAAGTVSSDLCQAFNSAGYLLPLQSVISAGAATGQGWTLTSPDNNYRYALKVDGSQIAVYAMNSQWTLLVGTNTAVFWADGKMIFSYTAPASLSALPKLFFGNKVAISQITSAIKPMANISFDDSRGMTIQSQLYADSQMVVSQSITDNMGRMAVRTKPTYLTSAQNPMFGYCQGFATMNWTAGTMTGLVNNAYPADNGYPFARQTFETSPLARITQESIPGDQFRVNGGKCTAYVYSAIAKQSGELVFSKKTTTNPNGNVFYEASTLLEQVISNVSISGTEIRNETFFNDSGNATVINAPNYFNPPANSSQSDWVTTQSFDFLNRILTLQQGAKAPSKYIYDKAGNIRFMQDAQGAAAGTFNYTTYDILSRPVETGYYTGTWNQQQLQQYADTDPSWPQNTPTWRQKNGYDANNSASNAIGRITNMQANNGNAGTADVTEKLGYDILGNTISNTLSITSFDSGNERVVSYAYNDLGTITSIVYPSETYAYSVFYKLNALNQITTITEKMASSAESTIGSFSYDATGSPLENNLALENNGTVKQIYGFNSPNWLLSINNQNQAGANLLQESLTYTDGGYSGAGYFDGTIASSAVQISGVNSPDQFQYAYDPTGQVVNADSSGNPSPAPGAQTQFNYDANGNIVHLQGHGATYEYTYNQGTQEVKSIGDSTNAGVIAQFGYDNNGNVTQLTAADSTITKSHNLTIAYDPATMLSTSVVNAITGGATINLTYGCRNERLMKEVTGGTAADGKKLYIRGTSAMPLQELFYSADGKVKTSVNYIYGPGGIIAMRKLNGASVDLFLTLKDHIGSVRAVINLSGTVVASYQYTTFGVLSSVNEPTPGFMPYLYTGQEYDAEIGLYNYRARFYYAGIGRFIAIDPGRQYFSPYIYASNNPVLFIDPTGMFSIGSFFSAIGGILIGAVEILIGVVIDVVAAAVAFFTGGLGTGASIAIGALSGIFYGAGISSITYSVFHFDDFSWKDYGIQMGIGAITGAFSGGFGAGIGIAAKSAQVALTEFAAGARFVGTALEYLGQGGAATVVKAGAWVAEKGSSLAGLATNGPVTAGWAGLVKGIGIGVIKSEAIGVSINTAKNVALGNNWDQGLGQVLFSSALSGSIGGLQVSNRVRYGTQ